MVFRDKYVSTNKHFVMNMKAYDTPESREIEIRFEDNIMSEGGNEGFQYPDQD